MLTRLLAKSLLLWLAVAVTAASQELRERPLHLQMIPLADGVAYNARNLDDDITRTEIFRLASKRGVDLSQPDDPLLAHSFQDGYLFYVFYNRLQNAVGDRPYVIQRVKKIEKFYAADGEEVDRKTTYLVEVFKTRAGITKGMDQHFGSFSLRDHQQRDVIKQLEIGYGEVAGKCEGTNWPFKSNILYTAIQDYAPDGTIYDAVKFDRSVRWNINVRFDADGNYRIVLPEFKVDLPGTPPAKEVAQPWKDPKSRRIVLTAGRGCTGIQLNRSSGRDIQRALGKPLEIATFPGSKHYAYAGGLSVKVENRKITSLFTRPSFGGRTARGIRLGDPKTKVRKAYGNPKGKPDEWQYRGIVFRFDTRERVESIFIFGR